MKIPNTTDEKPYIEFIIDKKGKIKLSATSIWWGGKNSGFTSSDGTEGNSCPPKHLKAYIKAFKEKKIKTLEKEILVLQKQLDDFKSQAQFAGIFKTTACKLISKHKTKHKFIN